MKKWIVGWVMLLAAGFVFAGKPVMIGAEEVAAWLEKNSKTQLVDVRTAEEHAEGHIKGVVLMPWADPNFSKRAAAELEKDQPVLLICRSGRCSLAAGKALEKMGFETILDLKDGMNAWEKAGQPVVKP